MSVSGEATRLGSRRRPAAILVFALVVLAVLATMAVLAVTDEGSPRTDRADAVVVAAPSTTDLIAAMSIEAPRRRAP